MDTKYKLVCLNCKTEVTSFKEWFQYGQKCPNCGKTHIEVAYNKNYTELKKLITDKEGDNTIWRYFEYLPLLHRKNIVTAREGDIGINQWEFLSKFAKEVHGINCKVYVYRNDENYATHTFKDAGASLATSVLKENGKDSYVVASTGNVANAFSYYMSKAGFSLSAFIPDNALKMNSAGVSYYGQKVFRVKGDYDTAKQVAAEYAKKHNILITGGNTDPLRVESKRTMVFQWLRFMPEFPTVYVQSLSGGTGPIAIEKGLREIQHLNLVKKCPRFILVQPSDCDPMAKGWQESKANNFPEGWRLNYPIYKNPVTKVPTLATGNPASYPVVSKLVKESEGDIISFDVNKSVDVVRMAAYESIVRIGPASAIALGGFFDSLKKGLIKNGDVVMINIGEGIDRAPDFFEELIYTEENVSGVDDCAKFNREALREKLWDKLK